MFSMMSQCHKRVAARSRRGADMRSMDASSEAATQTKSIRACEGIFLLISLIWRGVPRKSELSDVIIFPHVIFLIFHSKPTNTPSPTPCNTPLSSYKALQEDLKKNMTIPTSMHSKIDYRAIQSVL